MPGSMELFKKIRPKDINLEIAISDKDQVLTYYMIDNPALNSFSKGLSIERDGIGRYIITDEIKTSGLVEVLDTYLPENTEIDFFVGRRRRIRFTSS